MLNNETGKNQLKKYLIKKMRKKIEIKNKFEGTKKF
jgi:hypothetical protein